MWSYKAWATLCFPPSISYQNGISSKLWYPKDLIKLCRLVLSANDFGDHLVVEGSLSSVTPISFATIFSINRRQPALKSKMQM
jgi:hypothetical protein